MRIKDPTRILLVGIGAVYYCFGLLKFLPDNTPIQQLAQRTISKLSLGLVPSDHSLILLGSAETLLGMLLILGIKKRAVLFLTLGHVMLTFSSVVLFPQDMFDPSVPHLTLMGQYVFKNIIIVSGLLFLLSTSNDFKPFKR